jgi:hypothetical protein
MKNENPVYCRSEFPKLSETFILNQITGLIDRGHEVHIYATRKAAGALSCRC